VDNVSIVATLIDRAVAITALAKFIADHPDLPNIYDSGYRPFVYASDLDEFHNVRQILQDRAPVGAVTKDPGGDSSTIYEVARDFGADVSLRVLASRDLVCEQVQVGTRTVEQPVVVRYDTVEEPVFEWRCNPIFAAGDDDGLDVTLDAA